MIATRNGFFDNASPLMNYHQAWLDAIRNPATYPHPISEVRLIETHISWVVLTGDWVYKLKKPVSLGFVDFSTLELRHAACLEEVRLNRRTALSLYDGVVELRDNAGVPRFGGTGPILEYAVRMRQFAQEELLEQRLARNELSTGIIDELATEIADMHRQAAIAEARSPFGEPEAIRAAVRACLSVLERTSLTDELRKRLDELTDWTEHEWNRLKATLILRKQQGHVRECHGDLHLGNLVFYCGKPTPFDCLEFNAQLRWIDEMSDIAFLIMDLHDRDASPDAWRVLNGWLEQTGDYEGLAVLRYYLAYRALVRAKVAAIRLSQPELSVVEISRQHEQLESYVVLATRLSGHGQPAIIIMHGVSGSGKSHVAKALASSLGAIQIRSDVERKRLAGAWPPNSNSTPSTTEATLYSTESNRRTYSRLLSLVRTIVASVYPVIIDAAFLRRADRMEFAVLAKNLEVPFAIVACSAPESVLLNRIEQRNTTRRDPSDANANVFRSLCSTVEALQPDERPNTVDVDTSRNDLSKVVQSIQRIVCKRP